MKTIGELLEIVFTRIKTGYKRNIIYDPPYESGVDVPPRAVTI